MPTWLRWTGIGLLSGFGGGLHAAIVQMRLVDFPFVPNDVTISTGDTVRFINQEGFHDVAADPPVVQDGIFQKHFNQTGEHRVFRSLHSKSCASINGQMNPRITVTGSAPPAFAINQGISGAWYDSATSIPIVKLQLGSSAPCETLPVADSQPMTPEPAARIRRRIFMKVAHHFLELA